MHIYNSRNYSILLNKKDLNGLSGSTTVEIILYYLTVYEVVLIPVIYNSRNYSILLNAWQDKSGNISTTVEIILYYLTQSLTKWTEYLQQ